MRIATSSKTPWDIGLDGLCGGPHLDQARACRSSLPLDKSQSCLTVVSLDSLGTCEIFSKHNVRGTSCTQCCSLYQGFRPGQCCSRTSEAIVWPPREGICGGLRNRCRSSRREAFPKYPARSARYSFSLHDAMKFGLVRDITRSYPFIPHGSVNSVRTDRKLFR